MCWRAAGTCDASPTLCLLAPQAEATQAALERRAEELNATELRVRELQVGRQEGRLDCRPYCCCRGGVLLCWAPALSCAPSLQVRVEQQARALETREAELRTVEVC